MSKQMLELADEYERGLAKMEACGYEEYVETIAKHKLVIAALRQCSADSAQPIGPLGRDEDQEYAENMRSTACLLRVDSVLRHYAETYCEGWCKDAPNAANFDDCGGCRARLASSLTRSQADTLPQTASTRDELVSQAQFLLDRLEEFDPGEADAERDYHGHVTPAIARLREVLSDRCQAVNVERDALDRIAKFATSAEMQASVDEDCARSEFARSWHATAELADFRSGYDECINIARSVSLTRPQHSTGEPQVLRVLEEALRNAGCPSDRRGTVGDCQDAGTCGCSLPLTFPHGGRENA